MNQILDNSGANKSKVKKPVTDINKIIKVYAIIIIFFAVALIATGTYGIFSNSKNKAETPVTKPVIKVSQNDNRITIEVTHDKAIENVIYIWDNGKENLTKGLSNQTQMKIEDIGIPTGEHTLNVIAKDVNGIESSFSSSYSCENGVDEIEPKIDMQVEGTSVKIVATDETALSYITYQVNDEDEETIYASEENPDDMTTISKSIDIDLNEKCVISVMAFDTSNNVSSVEKDFTIYERPKIEVSAYENYEKLYVKVSSSLNITKIDYTLNDDYYETSFNESDNITYLEFEIPVTKTGENKLKISAYTSNDDIYKQYEATFNKE